MDQVPQPGPSSRRLTAVAVGTVAATLVIALAAWTLAPRATRASGPGGPRLSIAVVPPVEPELFPGEVLEVGTLNDAFDRAALERQPAEVIPADDRPPEAYVGEDAFSPQIPSEPQPPRDASPVAVVTSTNPLDDGSRLFGFDRRPTAPADRAVVAEGTTPEADPALASPNVFQ